MFLTQKNTNVKGQVQNEDINKLALFINHSNLVVPFE